MYERLKVLSSYSQGMLGLGLKHYLSLSTGLISICLLSSEPPPPCSKHRMSALPPQMGVESRAESALSGDNSLFVLLLPESCSVDLLGALASFRHLQSHRQTANRKSLQECRTLEGRPRARAPWGEDSFASSLPLRNIWQGPVTTTSQNAPERQQEPGPG